MNLLCSSVYCTCMVLIFILIPRFVSLVIKGQFFPKTKILFQSAIFFQVQQCSIEIFLSELKTPFSPNANSKK